MLSSRQPRPVTCWSWRRGVLPSTNGCVLRRAERQLHLLPCGSDYSPSVSIFEGCGALGQLQACRYPPAERHTLARRPRVPCTGPPPRALPWPPTMPTHLACSTTCPPPPPHSSSPACPRTGLQVPPHHRRTPTRARVHTKNRSSHCLKLRHHHNDVNTSHTAACIKNHLSSQRANLGRARNRLIPPSSMHVRVRVVAPRGTPAQLNAQGWSPSPSASGACKTRLPFAAADTVAASCGRSPPHARAWRRHTGASSVG